MRSDSKAQAREYKNLCLDVFFLPFRFSMDREQTLSYFFCFFDEGAAKVCAFSMFVVWASARPSHAESLQKEREMKVCAVWASALRGQKKSWERGGVCDKTFAAFKSVVRESG